MATPIETVTVRICGIDQKVSKKWHAWVTALADCPRCAVDDFSYPEWQRVQRLYRAYRDEIEESYGAS